jgi:hypothetical protein
LGIFSVWIGNPDAGAEFIHNLANENSTYPKRGAPMR